MRFYVLTLFPEMIDSCMETSIIGRAQDSNIIKVNTINIRDYSKDKHRHVDDYPYGGGAGMVMQAAPICDAYKDLCDKLGKKPKVIYVTPQGKVFDQVMAKEMSIEEDLVILCGHYEGIDERALELLDIIPVSIGDYVLTGGELPAMVLIDAVSRMVPGVLTNDESADFESFEDNLLEYPQYTRPEVYEGLNVPEVLMSGHHANIEKWRRCQSIKRTLERRPDLLDKARLDKNDLKYLNELKNSMSKE